MSKEIAWTKPRAVEFQPTGRFVAGENTLNPIHLFKTSFQVKSGTGKEWVDNFNDATKKDEQISLKFYFPSGLVENVIIAQVLLRDYSSEQPAENRFADTIDLWVPLTNKLIRQIYPSTYPTVEFGY